VSLSDATSRRAEKNIFVVAVGTSAASSQNLASLRSLTGEPSSATVLQKRVFPIADFSELSTRLLIVLKQARRFSEGLYAIYYTSPKRANVHSVELSLEGNQSCQNTSSLVCLITHSFSADGFQEAKPTFFIDWPSKIIAGTNVRLKVETRWSVFSPNYTWDVLYQSPGVTLATDPQDSSFATISTLADIDNASITFKVADLNHSPGLELFYTLYVGDGYLLGDDNCPFIFNPDQADSDQDGIGDVCPQDNIKSMYLDIDGSGIIDVFDTLIVQRYLGGVMNVSTNILLPKNVGGSGDSGEKTNQELRDQVSTMLNNVNLDVDGNAKTDVFDTLMIQRHLGGLNNIGTNIKLPSNVGGSGPDGSKTNTEIKQSIESVIKDNSGNNSSGGGGAVYNQWPNKKYTFRYLDSPYTTKQYELRQNETSSVYYNSFYGSAQPRLHFGSIPFNNNVTLQDTYIDYSLARKEYRIELGCRRLTEYNAIKGSYEIQNEGYSRRYHESVNYPIMNVKQASDTSVTSYNSSNVVDGVSLVSDIYFRPFITGYSYEGNGQVVYDYDNAKDNKRILVENYHDFFKYNHQGHNDEKVTVISPPTVNSSIDTTSLDIDGVKTSTITYSLSKQVDYDIDVVLYVKVGATFSLQNSFGNFPQTAFPDQIDRTLEGSGAFLYVTIPAGQLSTTIKVDVISRESPVVTPGIDNKVVQLSVYEIVHHDTTVFNMAPCDSDNATLEILNGSKPGAPGSLIGRFDGSSSVVLSWKEVFNASEYLIYYLGTEELPLAPKEIGRAPSFLYSNSTYSEGRHCFHVTTLAGEVESEASNVSCVDVPKIIARAVDDDITIMEPPVEYTNTNTLNSGLFSIPIELDVLANDTPGFVLESISSTGMDNLRISPDKSKVIYRYNINRLGLHGGSCWKGAPGTTNCPLESFERTSWYKGDTRSEKTDPAIFEFTYVARDGSGITYSANSKINLKVPFIKYYFNSKGYTNTYHVPLTQVQHLGNTYLAPNGTIEHKRWLTLNGEPAHNFEEIDFENGYPVQMREFGFEDFGCPISISNSEPNTNYFGKSEIIDLDGFGGYRADSIRYDKCGLVVEHDISTWQKRFYYKNPDETFCEEFNPFFENYISRCN
jgi:hypothetical protein